MEFQYNSESSEKQGEIKYEEESSSDRLKSSDSNSSFSNIDINESENFTIKNDEWYQKEYIYENKLFKPNTKPIYNKKIHPSLNKSLLEELSKINEKQITPKYFF